MITTRTGSRRLFAVCAALVATTVLAVGGIHPAGANHDEPPLGDDGPPVFDETPPTPQAHPPEGGTPIRIYGDGFLGTTEVTFGGVPALDFRVIDSGLITAILPPADPNLLSAGNDGFAHITITDDDGTATTDLNGNGEVEVSSIDGAGETGAIFYTDATLTLNPETGLDGGESIQITVADYEPLGDRPVPVVQANPLVNFIEDAPEDTDPINVGPSYGDVLFPFLFTDANGNATGSRTVGGGDEDCESPCVPFNLDDQDYDPDADCPVAQITADYGLDRCFIAVSQFGMGSIENYFSYSPDPPHVDPVPAEPTLALTVTSVDEGATVDVSGIHWNAAPHFGSDTVPDDPGETLLTIEICDTTLSNCTPAESAAAGVELVRYFDGDPSTPGVQGVYTGAVLSGSFTIPDTSGCSPDCVVLVRQQRYDIEANAPVPGEVIEATAALVVGGPSDGCSGPATIVGTNRGDVLNGTPGDDVIDGRGGNDVIRGSGGNDIICGGPGDDRLDGGRGDDDLFGGPGRDSCTGGRGRDTTSGCERESAAVL
ncbi:hypothetical protein BH18ACT4_BH18ACT4_04410 [soil metagenome]